jgi:signal peptidase II
MSALSSRTSSKASPRGRPAAVARALTLVIVVAIIDQLTKRAIRAGIAVGDVHTLLPGLRLVHVTNNGVAFGFLAGGGAALLVVTLVALVALTGFFIMHPTRRGLWIACGLLVGGALGNLIDRLTQGSVTDFVKLPLWPAFNLADTAITFGVFALLYVLEGGRRDER